MCNRSDDDKDIKRIIKEMMIIAMLFLKRKRDSKEQTAASCLTDFVLNGAVEMMILMQVKETLILKDSVKMGAEK